MGKTRAALLKILEEGGTLDLRADGKAGSGLVMTLQIFAEAVSLEGTYQVQEWPLFSAARKGANVRGFLRIGRGPIHVACQIEQPHIALLLTEKTGEEFDFASGMGRGLFVVNSPKAPETIARKFRLKGEVVTVNGDALGQKYLGHPLPNISVLAALQNALPLVKTAPMLDALKDTGKKRRLPQKNIDGNLSCFLASLEAARVAEVEGDETWTHPLPKFEGYAHYPTGAQNRLRTSLTNKTANYAPAAKQLTFSDPEDACTGCSLCIINCPEGIIRFELDEKREIRVTGADVNQFCKLCRECIEVCPLDLFGEKPLDLEGPALSGACGERSLR